MDKKDVEKTRKLLRKDIMSKKFYSKLSFDNAIAGTYILSGKTPEEIADFLGVPVKRVSACLDDFVNDEFYWKTAARYLASEKEHANQMRLSKK